MKSIDEELRKNCEKRLKQVPGYDSGYNRLKRRFIILKRQAIAGSIFFATFCGAIALIKTILG